MRGKRKIDRLLCIFYWSMIIILSQLSTFSASLWSHFSFLRFSICPRWMRMIYFGNRIKSREKTRPIQCICAHPKYQIQTYQTDSEAFTSTQKWQSKKRNKMKIVLALFSATNFLVVSIIHQFACQFVAFSHSKKKMPKLEWWNESEEQQKKYIHKWAKYFSAFASSHFLLVALRSVDRNVLAHRHHMHEV